MRGLALVLVALSCACVPAGSPAPSADVDGTSPARSDDAGTSTTTDGGTTADTSTGADASMGTDASTTADASTGADAATTPQPDAATTPQPDAATSPRPDAGAAPRPDAGPRTVTATNPVIPGDHPDPGVVRVIENGRATYYLTPTAGNGDITIFRSHDLVTWTPLPRRAFDRPNAANGTLHVNDFHYCSLWAPQITALGPASYMLSFTAQRYAAPRACGAYQEDSGVYLAWSPSPEGPFAPMDHPWEPLPAGGQISTCNLRARIPRSVDTASDDCQGTFCHHVIRLDSDVFRDPRDGRWWLAYAWYTNSPTRVAWERDNHGEHVSLVELDPADPFAVICDENVAQVFVANPHDGTTLQRLRASCPRCGETLSFTRGRQEEEMQRDGASWGVAEGPSLFRRGAWVYAIYSGSAWDSAYYHVAWAAAPSVPELALGSATRIDGRYLIPSDGNAFGHGTPVLGPDGTRWYYVHHRLRAGPCRTRGDCARDVWVSPIDFEDKGDGRGAVHIRPRFPAETPATTIDL